MHNNNGGTNGGGGGFELGILYVIFQIIDVGINDIPYVTLITIIGQVNTLSMVKIVNYSPPRLILTSNSQVLLYMRVIKVPWTNYEVCINVLAIIEKKDYRRLILAVFEHANDMHLYYNMMSYLIKGKYLEKKYGSKNFAFLLLFMAICSTSMDVLLCYLFSKWLKSPYLMNACGIGFSGEVLTHQVVVFVVCNRLLMRCARFFQECCTHLK